MAFPTKPKQHPNITNTHLPNKYDLDSEAHPVLYIISRCHVLLFVRQSRATVPPKTMFFATDFGAFLGSSRAESITSWWSSKGTLTIGRLEPDKFTIWPHQKKKRRKKHPPKPSLFAFHIKYVKFWGVASVFCTRGANNWWWQIIHCRM